jgi:peptidoglycan/xylan/chitin deacetylase (PgdA/CDA1 family)
VFQTFSRKIFEKRGILGHTGALTYRTWNKVKTARPLISARALERRLIPVSECLQNSNRVWFLGSEESFLTAFAADYWNECLNRLNMDAPGAKACDYKLMEDQVSNSDVFFVLNSESFDKVASEFPQIRKKTFQLQSSASPEIQALPDFHGLSVEQQQDTLRRTRSALNTMMDTFFRGRCGSTHPLQIFMFHAVVSEPLKVPNYCFIEEDLFKHQLDIIERYFRILSLSDAVREMQSGNLAEPTAVITFDDGYHNNYTVAFPELQRRGIPASIFVSTGFVDGESTPWFCRILSAVSDTDRSSFSWKNKRYKLSGPHQKSQIAARLMEQLKRLPQDEVNEEIRAIEVSLGIEPGRSIGHESPFRMMSSQAVIRMAQSGLIEFGGHTDSHAILSRLSRVPQRNEILSSISSISDWLGRPCSLFAYPNGQFTDFDDQAVEVLKEAGISIALTAAPGHNHWYENAMKLRRQAVGPNDRGWLFESRVRCLIENGRKLP